MLIYTRAEALRDGKKTYFTGKPCKHGHIDYRFTSRSNCRSCLLQKNAVHREENREYHRARTNQWRVDNPAKVLAKNSRRRAHKLKATPVWADQAAILAIYEESRRLTEETGKPHHVDHIFPLKGTNCCGLHVETNLRVVEGSENLKKHNKMPNYRFANGHFEIIE
jgi:hypothetical protein